jgi:hypothetical protein
MWSSFWLNGWRFSSIDGWFSAENLTLLLSGAWSRDWILHRGTNYVKKGDFS